MAAEEAVRKERAARSLAIERAYVHDVYEQESDDPHCTVFHRGDNLPKISNEVVLNVIIFDETLSGCLRVEMFLIPIQ